MKKLNNKFKLLSEEACNKVKGGSWLANFFYEGSNIGRREWSEARRRVNGEGNCPPPDPTEY